MSNGGLGRSNGVIIAVDGMGGDGAPRVVVDGAAQAAKEYGFSIVLIGDRSLLEAELSKHRPAPGRIDIHHASEVIGMDESPATSIRRKRDSSINVAVNLAKEKKVDAIVTAGNTGAAVCATTLILRTLKGIERPGIMVAIPTLAGLSLLIDVGANVDPKPEHILQYAIMADVCSEYILGKREPRIGLLNIGEEESKGTEFIKEAYRLLDQSRLNFIGNIEGKDIFTGRSEVIVCDGFVGNIVLKVSENLAETIGEFLERELSSRPISRLGGLMSRPAFSALKKKIDYSEYGGAPLLGIDGICIVSHGRSSAKAIKNAIRVASEFATHRINQRIMEAIKQI